MLSSCVFDVRSFQDARTSCKVPVSAAVLALLRCRMFKSRELKPHRNSACSIFNESLDGTIVSVCEWEVPIKVS